MDGNRPLDKLRVVEFEGLGSVPYVGMLLADMGAQVVRIARPESPEIISTGPARVIPEYDYTSRGRLIWKVDLKEGEREAVERLIRSSDVLIEGFRPGVMERLRLGPDDVFAMNEDIVYARLSGLPRGFSQEGEAVHDINLLASSGVLHALGMQGQPPRIPLNLLADYGAGSLFGYAILATLADSRLRKQKIVDISMLGSLSTMLTAFYGLVGQGSISPEPGTSYLDGAAPFYRTYKTSDGRYLAVGAVELRFYQNFLHLLGLSISCVGDPADSAQWSSGAEVIAKRVSSRPLKHWKKLFKDTETCVTPVLTPQEAAVADPMAITLESTGDWVQPRPILGGLTPPQARFIANSELSQIISQWERRAPGH